MPYNLTPSNSTTAKILAILRKENPKKKESDYIQLLSECVDTGMNAWALHGFLISGYAEGWKYYSEDKS